MDLGDSAAADRVRLDRLKTYEVTFVVIVEATDEEEATDEARQLIANPAFEAFEVIER